MKTTPDQLSLPLFDTTALTSSMGLWAGLSFGEPVDGSIAETEEDAPAPVVVPARNFRLAGARRLAPDRKTRAADNIAAIRLMRQIEEETRNATPEEQERLALFTSFGASDLANNVFRRSAGDAFPKGWDTLGEDLEQRLAGQLASLARVTQYAHFTPEFMVRAVWRALRHMGFSGGRVLEPGCGTGLFFALMPEVLEAKTTLTGVEMDPVTARITKLLYPNARIRAEDFTKARIAETYDLVIGNPPFSSRTVRADDPAGRLRLSLHDYFIARSIERLRPADRCLRHEPLDHGQGRSDGPHILASMADLVGDVRLPEGAMRAAAGTDVVVDILFFQKRGPEEPAKPADWIDLPEVMAAQDGEEAISINRRFVERPNMVLGSHARTSSAYGPTYTCEPFPADRIPDAGPARGAPHASRRHLCDPCAGEARPRNSVRRDHPRRHRGRRCDDQGGQLPRRQGHARPDCRRHSSPFRSATARVRTAYQRGMRASSGASFRSATPFATSCGRRKPISRGVGLRFGCADLTRTSSGSSARST